MGALVNMGHLLFPVLLSVMVSNLRMAALLAGAIALMQTESLLVKVAVLSMADRAVVAVAVLQAATQLYQVQQAGLFPILPGQAAVALLGLLKVLPEDQEQVRRSLAVFQGLVAVAVAGAIHPQPVLGVQAALLPGAAVAALQPMAMTRAQAAQAAMVIAV
jgi:hypothetical protein